jgi:hypothetical protein
VAAVALGDRDDEAEVRVDHALLRREVAALDALRERDLVGRRQQRVLADLGEEQLQRVGREEMLGGGCRRLVGVVRDLDAAIEQRSAQLVGRGLVEIVLVRERLQLGDGDPALLLGLGEERLGDGSFDRRAQRCVLSSGTLRRVVPRACGLRLRGGAGGVAWCRGMRVVDCGSRPVRVCPLLGTHQLAGLRRR